MSAKTTGTIWDLELSAAQRMVLLAMADHADHAGAHIHAPIAFIAWKTGYSERNVTRIVQDLLADGLLVLTGAEIGIANEYRFDFSRGKLKDPYSGRKPKTPKSTHDKMSGVPKRTHDKMSGVVTGSGKTHDKMSPTHDNMAWGTPDKMAIDHESSLYRDHDSTTTTMVGGGGGEISNEDAPAKTDLYHWLRSNGVDSPEAAARNQHHDPAATQALYRRIVGDAIGDDRKRRIGRFIKVLDADGPPPIVAAPHATLPPVREPLPPPPTADELAAVLKRYGKRE